MSGLYPRAFSQSTAYFARTTPKTTSKAHQNEKICQHAMQSTFLTVIIYSSLALSLLLSFFFLRVRSFFVFFGAWFPSQTRNIIPQKKPIRQPFPLHTRFKSETFHRENAYFSLTHSCRASFAIFSFLAEDIYTTLYILLLLSRCLEIQESA